VEDFWDMGVQTIFNTVKEEAEQGNVFSGQEQFLNIHTKHLDRFTSKNFHMNTDNRNYTDLTNFYLLDEAPSDIEMRSCMEIVKNKRAMRDLIHNLYTGVDMCTHEDNGVEKAYQFLGDMVFSHETEKAKEESISKLDFAEGMTRLLYEYNDPEKRKTKTINMPWKKFQRIIGGFGLEELEIVSARSGQGKSAFALNVGI
jgi:replicative DNA helicase